jgi:hypothetical protein
MNSCMVKQVTKYTPQIVEGLINNSLCARTTKYGIFFSEGDVYHAARRLIRAEGRFLSQEDAVRKVICSQIRRNPFFLFEDKIHIGYVLKYSKGMNTSLPKGEKILSRGKFLKESELLQEPRIVTCSKVTYTCTLIGDDYNWTIHNHAVRRYLERIADNEEASLEALSGNVKDLFSLLENSEKEFDANDRKFNDSEVEYRRTGDVRFYVVNENKRSKRVITDATPYKEDADEITQY